MFWIFLRADIIVGARFHCLRNTLRGNPLYKVKPAALEQRIESDKKRVASILNGSVIPSFGKKAGHANPASQLLFLFSSDLDTSQAY
jgi:hypothetical protein